MQLSGYSLDRLRDDGEFILYRAHAQQIELPSVLLLAPASTRPSPETLKKIGHEYSLRNELDPAWAVRPVALSEGATQMTLVLEDPGGEALDGFLLGAMQMTKFLGFAVGLATALGGLHERKLIHKDVKPTNVLVNSATGQVRLMGFGIASRLRREHQVPEPPELIAGTLPYMAPEQTGRMNRSIDSRSDLYALGVTLYEMLTGNLPFTASDPIEWVHSHIARHPVPPHERVKSVPACISAIVMKLLAKTPEERYQTASGVESDLRRCLAGWEAHGCIADFSPGQHDAPDRLLIPEKLYGRARPEHPLALFLDDLQWLDAATLDLMEDLLTQPDVKHLMLIGAYRDNEVDPTHPLMRKLQAMRQAGALLQDIVLAPLTREDLEQLIAGSLRYEPTHAGPLAQLVHDKTTGNPFFAIQFLSALFEEGLLTFDHVEGRWSWDLNRIHAKGYTDNVVDLMVRKLARLVPATQNALSQLACLGNSAEFTMLRMVYQDSMEQMHTQLAEAVGAGFILHLKDSYRFLHDRVQEAAYSLIPEEGRAPFYTPHPGGRWLVTSADSAVVLIVDDDTRMRAAMRRLLKTVGLHSEVFATPEDFLRHKLPSSPSCLVLDVRLPGMSGLEVQSKLTEMGVHIPIIFITCHADIPMTVKAMKSGAVEFLTKPFRDQDLIDAIHQALKRDSETKQQQSGIAELRERYARLTAREREVMLLIVSGMLTKQIASTLGTTDITATVHRGQVMHKMQANSPAELGRMAEKLKLPAIE